MMGILRDTFLFRAYNEFKLLFVVVIVFIAGMLWFALKSHEEFPFLLFGMYSLQEKAQDEYIAYSIVVDSKEVVYRNMNDAQNELVVTSLSNAAVKNSPLSDVDFTNWLKRYTAGGKSMEIYKLTCLYTPQGQPLIKKRDLIYPYDRF